MSGWDLAGGRGFPRATALAIVLLGVVLLVYALQKRLMRRYEEFA